MSQIALQLSRPWETRAGLRRPQEGPITVSVDVAQQIVEAGAVSEEEAERVTELIEELTAETEVEAKPKRAKKAAAGKAAAGKAAAGKAAAGKAAAPENPEGAPETDAKPAAPETAGKDDKAGAAN